MATYRVTVTLESGAQRQTASFSDFGDANRWAMGYLRGLGVGREAWVVEQTGLKIAAGYITGPTGAVRVSARAERDS